MGLQLWLANGWLKKHASSREEIANLLGIVERDLSDAKEGGISADWRFGISYNAALKLCSILLYAEGYRPEKTLQHYRAIQALPLVLGATRRRDADYLDACRSKRNVVEYDYAGGATDADADELIEFANELKTEVLSWVKMNHPKLMPE